MGGGNEDDDDAEDEEDEEEPKLAGQDAKQAKQLDSITDFVEEKEGEASKVDTKEVEARLNDLRRKKEESDRQRAEREKQLAAVRIKKEDLDLVGALKSAVRSFPTNS